MDSKKLVSSMTLEEKASLCSGEGFWHTKAVERLGVPAVMVSDGPHGLRKQSQAEDNAGVNDSIKAVCFPAACATTSSFDRELVKTLGEALGEECQAEQVSVILGPAINIKRSPLCGRNFEYYSEDPYLAGEMAAAYINGMQSKNIGVSLKHFAANNQEHRRMSSSSNMSERTLREIYFKAFEIAVKKAKPWTVMCSYNRINGVFSAENRWLLTDVLRGEWGFDGYVVSDWGAICDRVKGLEAGLELEMPGSNGERDKLIVKAVKEGRLDEAVLDTACERLLNINYRYLENARPDSKWDMPAHHRLAAKIASECMVLLKNEGGVLPLCADKKLAFIGEFAEKPRFQGGGSSHINCCEITSALQASKGLDVIYAKGYDVATDSASDALIAEAVAAAKSAYAAVVFAGLPDQYESEGYDRTHMRLPECQNRLIAAVAAANPNTVVVLHNGSPVEMPWVKDVKGILEAYLGGQAVGIATLDILLGRVNPSGKLAESFPLRLEDNPSYIFYGGEKDEADYREGVFVGYRYYDKKRMDVLFPFGYGLSYTTFEYSNLKLSTKRIKDTEALTVSVDVTNTGKLKGKEAVQLYVTAPCGDVIRPEKELKGFDKLELEPGQAKTAQFTLDKSAFAYWNEALHDWHVESGDYGVLIGGSSRDIALRANVTVESTVTLPVRYDENSLFGDILKDERAASAAQTYMDLMKKALGPNDGSGDGDAAVSNDMMEAMLRYMPLRAVLGLAAGSLTGEQLEDFIRALNDR